MMFAAYSVGRTALNLACILVTGVIVMEDATRKPGTSGMLFWVDYVPPTNKTAPYTVTVGSTNVSISSQYQRLMPNSDLCCGAFPNATNVTDFVECQRACDADSKCEAWTFKPRAEIATLYEMGVCTKRGALSNTAQTMWRDVIHSPGSTSGVKAPSLVLGGRVDRLQLTPTEHNLTIQVFVDQVMAEGFWQSGRVAMTRECDPPLEKLAGVGMSLFSSAAANARAQAWALHDAWITPQQLLKQPRIYH
jgi:hypothetical protein